MRGQNVAQDLSGQMQQLSTLLLLLSLYLGDDLLEERHLSEVNFLKCLRFLKIVLTKPL